MKCQSRLSPNRLASFTRCPGPSASEISFLWSSNHNLCHQPKQLTQPSTPTTLCYFQDKPHVRVLRTLGQTRVLALAEAANVDGKATTKNYVRNRARSFVFLAFAAFAAFLLFLPGRPHSQKRRLRKHSAGGASNAPQPFPHPDQPRWDDPPRLSKASFLARKSACVKPAGNEMLCSLAPS